LAVLLVACGGVSEGNSARWTVFDIPAASTTAVRDVVQYPGEEHCGWASVTFLELSENGTERHYVRDPEGVIRTEPPPEPFATLPALPEAAVWTGWHRKTAELWLASDGSAAYVGKGDDWERWPRTPAEVGCD
jgi:hypothetical protein